MYTKSKKHLIGVLKERKSAGAGYAPKGKLRGRKSAWMNGTQGEKKTSWEEEAGTSRGIKNVIRSCKEKIRKVRAQSKLNLANSANVTKEVFCKYINYKRRKKENLLPSLNVEGNFVSREGEKSEYLMLLLPQSLTERPVILRAPNN